ncbi:MAG: hypothetical protein H0W72_17150 [Planctomycetes bacterium]|nr:hypothetical protein [Planctomycetota bacterium]
MLAHLLNAHPARHDRWIEGLPFAWEGRDELDDAEHLVAALGTRRFDLVLGTQRQRRLEVRAGGISVARLVAADVIAAETHDGNLVVAFADSHTLIGELPEDASASLSEDDGTPSVRRGNLSLSVHGDDVIALASCGRTFSVARGASIDQARARALAGLVRLPWFEAEERLARVGTTALR